MFSQSETLSDHIEIELEEIESRIQNKKFEQALLKIEQLESYSAYTSVDKNRLNLNLLKAKALYGNKEPEESMNLLLSGFNELSNQNELLLIGEYSLYLGQIFAIEKNYNKAIEYYKTFLNNSLKRNDTTEVLKANLFIGGSYHVLDKLDSADYYYNEVIQYPVNEKSEEIISNTYNNFVDIARDVEDFELAEDYANKMLTIEQQFKDTVGISLAFFNLGNIANDNKEFIKANKNYLNSFELIKGLNTPTAISRKEYLLYGLSDVNKKLKDFEKAYQYLEEATDLKDSLSDASIAQNFSEIEAKYNVLEAEKKAEEEEAKHFRTQLLFYGLAIAFLLFLVFGYIFYNNYRLKQRHKLELVENEMNTRIINATIDAKEKERKTIAEILHDSVSALLSSANLHLMASKSQLKKSAPKEISKAQGILNEASIKIRDLSHELISSVLLKFGLAFAVHDMCQKYSNSEISLFSDDNGIKRYDQDFEIKIHNIIEELINNILKHSKASNATIMLAHRKDDKLSIRINDDGVGFDIDSVRQKDGLGLSHINARVKIMKGIFNIESSKNEGTSIFILVPIKFKEEET